MSDFAETWGSADPDAAGGEDNEAPLGKHVVALEDPSAFMSKKEEAWVIFSWKLVVPHDGLEAGYTWKDIYGFRSQAQANVSKGAVRDLGIDVEDVDGLDGIDAALKERAGKYYEVEVVQNGNFRNTYIKGEAVAGDIPADVPAPSAEAAAKAEEDIPF